MRPAEARRGDLRPRPSHVPRQSLGVYQTVIKGQGFSAGDASVLLTDEVGQAFVDATLCLLADGELRQRVGDAARARVLAQYSWRAQVRKMERIYEELRG